MANKKEWFVIPKYKNYEMSSELEVRHIVLKKIKKFYTDEHGYLRTNIQMDGKKVKPGKHQLVAITFIPNPENKPEVNHKDGDKLNNEVSNLEWATQLENKRHALENGLVFRKVTDEGVVFIRENYNKIGADELAKKFKVSVVTINSIAVGRTRRYVSCPAVEVSTTKKIINTITNEIYESVEELSKITGKPVKSLRRMLSGERYNRTPFRYFIRGEVMNNVRIPPPPRVKIEKPKFIRPPKKDYIPHPLTPKRVVMYGLTGKEIRVFASAREAAIFAKTNLATFRKWIRSTTTGFHKGFVFKYEQME